MELVKLTYPEIEGANPIIGFVDKQHNRVDIHPGETVEVLEDTASQMLVVFPFLFLGELELKVQKGLEGKEEKKVSLEEMSWEELRAYAKEVGYKGKMNKAAILKALEK